MNCSDISERLDDFVDRRLDDRTRRAVELHVARCDACAAAVDGLRSLQSAVAALPREVAPSRDLFPEIRASLDRSERPPWRMWVGVAAGLFLTAVVLRLGLPTPEAPLEPALRIDRPASAELRNAELQFREAAAELIEALDARDDLSPETRAILDENLAIVDRAIAEVRAALTADPANLHSGRSLQALYRQKLNFLWTASRVSS